MSATSIPTPSTTKRLVCCTCHRAQRACICQWIRPVANAPEVLILQHPLEVNHAKNSALLLHLSLPRSRILSGEVFDADHLRALVNDPLYTVLLYPQTATSLPERAPDPDPTRMMDPARLRLVILDGTWRKSRKMLYANPLLQSLPRLSLDGAPASQYRIRKAHRPGQLSTLEAACAALILLEGDAKKYQPVLDAFDGFVEQQLAYQPQTRVLAG